MQLGLSNMKPVPDPETPGGGHALQVAYPAPSGPPSCKCGIGGGQLYQDLKAAGREDLVKSPTIDLKYHYKFPVGFDFGKSTGGKMPGLYGGVPGCESGGQHCGGSWSTRYMWRGGSKSEPNGEIYFYAGTASGYGADSASAAGTGWPTGSGTGSSSGSTSPAGSSPIWHDGKQVFETKRSFGGTPLTGIFFSTFHGGHDTGWSPSKPTMAEFAAFTLSTEGPQTEAAAADAGVDAAAVTDGPGGAGRPVAGRAGARARAGTRPPGHRRPGCGAAGGSPVDGRRRTASAHGSRLRLGRRHQSQWNRGHRSRARSGAPPTAEQVAKVALTKRPGQ